jgi:hypothetical protein
MDIRPYPFAMVINFHHRLNKGRENKKMADDICRLTKKVIIIISLKIGFLNLRSIPTIICLLVLSF